MNAIEEIENFLDYKENKLARQKTKDKILTKTSESNSKASEKPDSSKKTPLLDTPKLKREKSFSRAKSFTREKSFNREPRRGSRQNKDHQFSKHESSKFENKEIPKMCRSDTGTWRKVKTNSSSSSGVETCNKFDQLSEDNDIIMKLKEIQKKLAESDIKNHKLAAELLSTAVKLIK